MMKCSHVINSFFFPLLDIWRVDIDPSHVQTVAKSLTMVSSQIYFMEIQTLAVVLY